MLISLEMRRTQEIICSRTANPDGIMLADRDLTERSGESRVSLFSGDVISEPMRFKVEKRFIKQSQTAPE